MDRKKVAQGVLALLLLTHLLLVPFRSGFRQMGTDFPNYYTAAVLTLKHQSLRQFYDWVWFQRQIDLIGFRQLGGYVPHTPLTMVPLLPLTVFTPQRAKQLWLILGMIFLIASILLLSKLSRLSKLEVTVLALLAHRALGNNFLLGQYYLLILLLLTCGTWCLLRGRPFVGGALLGVIFALKLYSAPFILYFAARRQWKAFAGFMGIVSALALIAVAVFGWRDIWFFITTVMARGIDGSVNDPYNPGWASMTALLRRTFVPEAELNPHPVWRAPAAFFFLRATYTLGVLAVALLAGFKRSSIEEPKLLGWFVVVLFVLSPNEASYHFILLLVAIVLLLPGESRRRSTILILLYIAVELPLVRWDAAWFPKAWLLFAIFLYGGWPFLRTIGKVPLIATLLLVITIATASMVHALRIYHAEPPQTLSHAVVDPAAIYSSSPVFGGDGLVFDSLGTDRYVIRTPTSGGTQTIAFDGDVFRPAAPLDADLLVFELVRDRASGIYKYDRRIHRLQPVVLPKGLEAIDPAISQDGSKLAFVSRDDLYLFEKGELTMLAHGTVADPSFFPNGDGLVFSQGSPGHRHMSAVTITARVVRILVDGGDCFQPAVSPNGQLLAFACSGTGEQQIWILELKSGKRRQITRGSCNNGAPAWYPDSQQIAFASDCGRGLGLPALYRASVSRGDE